MQAFDEKTDRLMGRSGLYGDFDFSSAMSLNLTSFGNT